MQSVTIKQKIWVLSQIISLSSLVLFCLDTKKNEKKSSTNTAPLPSASRLAAARSRVGRAVRAHPPCNSKLNFHNYFKGRSSSASGMAKRRACVGDVRKEHLFALSFLVLFSTKCFIPHGGGKKDGERR